MKKPLFATLPLALAVLAPAQTPNPTAERKALYAWFDSLGFTDEFRGTFVEIKQPGGVLRYYPPESVVEYGFITHGDASHFTALSVGLEERKSLEPPITPDEPPLKSTAHRIDLRAWLENQKALSQRRIPGDDGPHPYFTGFGSRAEDLLYARLADLRGYPDLADWFYAQMQEAWGRNRSPAQDEREDLVTGVKHDFADEFLQRATRAFADTSVSREQLLRRFIFVVDHFPNGKTRTKAQDFVERLEAMIAADRVHKAVSKANFAAMPPESRARELVWQLENQTASATFRYESVLGRLSPFMDEGTTHGAPADELTQLGWAAIPALLNAFHDTRFIRAIQEDDWSSHQVLLVRDAAMQILMAITFEHFATYEDRFSSDAEAEDADRKAIAWWSSVKGESEGQYLVEQVSAGAEHSGVMARRLIKLRPEAALAAIRSGIPRADDSNLLELVSSLGELKPKEAASTARDQMLNGKSLGLRLTAARVLYKSDPEAAVAAMMREWTSVNEPQRGPLRASGLKGLENFLASSGRPEAL